MIRVLESPDCQSHNGIYGYPCDCVMLTASDIADISPPAEARRAVQQLFEEQCFDILGAGDRRELLDDFFARRARERGKFLEGTGLCPDHDIPGCFLPGSWFLDRERRGHGIAFTIRGVYAADGRMVSVPLNSKHLLSTGATLRAVKRAVGADGRLVVAAADWQRIWNGFEHCEANGKRQWVAGLRYLLHKDFMWREGLSHQCRASGR